MKPFSRSRSASRRSRAGRFATPGRAHPFENALKLFRLHIVVFPRRRISQSNQFADTLTHFRLPFEQREVRYDRRTNST
jgi:hypothetical protein